MQLESMSVLYGEHCIVVPCAGSAIMQLVHANGSDMLHHSLPDWILGCAIIGWQHIIG